MRAASACRYCALEISRPSWVTAELLDTFCALKGATFKPWSAKSRHKAITRVVLPASELVPKTANGFICNIFRDVITIDADRFQTSALLSKALSRLESLLQSTLSASAFKLCAS